MRLGRHTNGISCEDEMQAAFVNFIHATNSFRGLRRIKPIIWQREVRVKEVHRIADFLMVKNNSLVNVEAKCNDFKCMMKQLDDHAEYCDYCFAYIPDYSVTPVWFKKKLAEKGYGLIVYKLDTNQVTEVLEAHVNRGLNLELKSKIKKQLKSQIVRKTKRGKKKIR